MRKTYLITLLLCCFSALLNGAVSPFSFSSLKMEEGLSQLSVLKIHQDKSGFMWFATRNGLNRYDGNSFVVYKHSNGDSLSLSSNHVTALAEDDRGNLWVGTMNGLNRMDRPSAPARRITAAASTPNSITFTAPFRRAGVVFRIVNHPRSNVWKKGKQYAARPS